MKYRKTKPTPGHDASSLSPSSDLIFIWNTLPYTNVLTQQFGAKNVVTSEKDLTAFDSSRIMGIVIAAELNWGGHKLSEFYGIEILKKLRAEYRLTLPVIFCSFLPEAYFYSTEQRERFELLKTPGHIFRQLPFSFDMAEIEKHLPGALDEDTLEDIVESFCDIEGLLNERIHQLKNKVILKPNETSLTPDKIKNKLITAIKDSFSDIATLLSDTERVSEIKNRLITELETKVISTSRYDRAVEVISSFTGELQMLLPAKPQTSPHRLTQKPQWKVLYIDDEEHLRQRVQKEFEERNINCVTASGADEAFNLLKDDEGTNWITALIVDYRLWQPDGKLQAKQGYTLLKDVYLHRPNFLSFFALTAVHRKALLRTQRNYKMRVMLYTKEDVLSSAGAFNIFSEKVREEAKRMYDAVCSQPQLTHWYKSGGKNKKPLKSYYRAHRIALDYEDVEKWINEQAKKYVEHISRAFDKNDPEPKGHEFDFQSELSDSPENPQILEKFRHRLLGRRIAIGLYVVLGITRELIYFAMRKKPCLEIDRIPVNKRPKKKSIDALLNTALALSIEEDIPEHLLVEEREWLKNTMNIDLDEANTDAYQALEVALESFLERLKVDKKDVPDSDKTFIIKITNYKTAEKWMKNAVEIAEKHNCQGLLKNELQACWQEAQDDKQLKQAFRVSGVETLLKNLGVITKEEVRRTHAPLSDLDADGEDFYDTEP